MGAIADELLLVGNKLERVFRKSPCFNRYLENALGTMPFTGLFP